MAGNTGYKNNWAKEKLDRISLTVPKGRKEELQEHAQQQGESLNAFINRAIKDAIERDINFANMKAEIIASFEKCDTSIEDEYQLKRLAEAFSVLEPQIPDIKSRYFYKLASDKNIVFKRMRY